MGKKRSKEKVEEKVSKKMKKEHSEDENEVNSFHEKVVPATSGSKVLEWEIEDLTVLINNLAKCLPKNDIAKYSTLIEKLDWEKVRFSKYTAQECKEKWAQVMFRLRRYRTLTDMVTDAKAWLKAPWQTYNNAKKIKHPDFPKKPLTPFFRYFMEKRVKAGKSHPGMSVTDLAKMLSEKFRTLPEKKKQKYKDAYEREYEEYKDKLQKFKLLHPEVDIGHMTKHHSQGQEGPSKPRTPYQLFFEEKIKKEPKENHNKKEVIDKIKTMWSQLSEGKKIKWIRRSLNDEQRYETEVLEYTTEHPNFEATKLKPVLSKIEKELKDKYDGKPERPPNSGYSLYSKIFLRELKEVPSKEKMVVIAKRWKELPEAERNSYNKEAQKAMTKYVEKFDAYLSQLPEAERVKALNDKKLKLPNEKKLKQTEASNSDKKAKGNKEKLAKEQAAMLCYQMDRLASLEMKHPEMDKSEQLKQIWQEWNEKLSNKKKEKYFQLAETVYTVMPTAKKEAASSKAKKSTTADFLKLEPKKPPKSGYALFTSEQLTQLKSLEPKKRMQEIARKWNHDLDKKAKEEYDVRVKDLQQKYQQKLNEFIKGLPPDQQSKFNQILNERNKKGKGKAKDVVVEQITPIAKSNAIEDGASDSDNDEEEKYDTPQEQASSSNSEESDSDEAEDSEDSD